jgi:hypothetical protein
MRSIECSINKDEDNPMGWMNTWTNYWSKGTTSGGVGVDKLSGLIGKTRHNMHLLILICLTADFLISEEVDLGAEEVIT